MNPLDNYKIEVIYVETGTTKSPSGQVAGQHDTTIRITHIPTKLMAECGLYRSQHKNKQVAMEMIEWAILNIDTRYTK